jgi:hypothetical protein
VTFAGDYIKRLGQIASTTNDFNSAQQMDLDNFNTNYCSVLAQAKVATLSVRARVR